MDVPASCARHDRVVASASPELNRAPNRVNLDWLIISCVAFTAFGRIALGSRGPGFTISILRP